MTLMGQDIPNDEEQQAAVAGVQTQAQIEANQNMLLQNARNGQRHLDKGAADRLQEGFDSARQRAINARPLEVKIEASKPVVKESRWAWLTNLVKK